MLFSLLAQTTMPSTRDIQNQIDRWIAILGSAIVGIGGLYLLTILWIGKIRSAWKDQQTTNSQMASSIKDVGTQPNGSPLPNVSPETMPALNKIIQTGTGTGTDTGT